MEQKKHLANKIGPTIIMGLSFGIVNVSFYLIGINDGYIKGIKKGNQDGYLQGCVDNERFWEKSDENSYNQIMKNERQDSPLIKYLESVDQLR